MPVMTLDHAVLNVTEIDISTAGSVFVVSPTAGKIEKIYSVIDGAIATADTDITTEINGVAVTGSLITIATASSAAGDVDSSIPTGANIVNAGDVIEIITDGASTNTVSATYTVVIKLAT